MSAAAASGPGLVEQALVPTASIGSSSSTRQQDLRRDPQVLPRPGWTGIGRSAVAVVPQQVEE
jgi:hypothetical protein